MMTGLFVLLTSAVLSGAPIEDDGDLFREGIRLYREARYEEALGAFKASGKAGGDEGIVACNMGNCLFRMKKYSEALHSYLVAEKRRPRDGSVAENIRVTLTRIGTPVPGGEGFVGFVRKATGFLTAGEYLGIASVLLTLFFCFGAFCFGSGKRLIGKGMVLLVVPAVLLAGLSGFVRHGPRGWIGVVVQEAALVRTEPAVGSETRFSLREGEVVSIVRERNNWYEIEDSEGHRAWARSAAVRKVR